MVTRNERERLLNRPLPKVRESLYSWLVRLGCKNGFPRPSWIKSLLDLNSSNERTKAVLLPTEQQYQIIEKASGISRARISNLAWSELLYQNDQGSYSLFRSFFTRPYQQICPRCVKQNGIWHKSWDLNAVACCSEHECYLISRCYCGAMIPVFPNNLWQCNCGRRFFGNRSTTAPTILCDYVQCIENSGGRDLTDSLFEHRFLSWYWAQCKSDLKAKPVTKWSIRERHFAAKFVAKFSFNRETELFKLLDKYVHLRRKATGIAGFRSELGDLQDSLKRMVAQGYKGNVVDIFDKYLEEHWPGRFWLVDRLGSDYKSQKSLQLELGIRECVFQRLIQNAGLNEIACKRREYFDARKQSLLKRCHSEMLSLTDIAKHLGISYHLARLLVKEGVIAAEAPNKCLKTRNWQIRRDDINNFKQAIIRRSSNLEVESVSIREFMSGVLKPGVTFNFIITQILHEKLCCQYSSDASLLDIKVGRSDLDTISPKAKAGSRLLQVSDVAKKLLISCKMVHSLVRKKLLVPYKEPGHHKRIKKLVFTLRDVIKLQLAMQHKPSLITLSAASFMLGTDRSWLLKQIKDRELFKVYRLAEYPGELFVSETVIAKRMRIIARSFTGPELARELGISRNTVYKWMKSGRVQAVSGPDIDGLGCYRYRKTDALRFRQFT